MEIDGCILSFLGVGNGEEPEKAADDHDRQGHLPENRFIVHAHPKTKQDAGHGKEEDQCYLYYTDSEPLSFLWGRITYQG